MANENYYDYDDLYVDEQTGTFGNAKDLLFFRPQELTNRERHILEEGSDNERVNMVQQFLQEKQEARYWDSLNAEPPC